jgi:TonB family protein
MVRKAEFPATGRTFRWQPNAASDSAATQAPQKAIQKPSPSARSRQAAPVTTASAGSATVSRDAESRGALLRVNPEVLPAAQQSIRGQVNVSVRVKVDSAGNVTNAELESPSRSNYFNRVSVDAARQWKFAADTSGAWQIQFQFRHDGTDLSATRE